MTFNWEQYKVDIPAGKSGEWEVALREVDADEIFMTELKGLANGWQRGHTKPGTYTMLYHQNSVIMSDTRDEIRDHFEPIQRATGVCRVHGLGLGMVTAAMLNKPEVERVDVVELSVDVINLVAPTLQARYGDRFRLIIGNVLDKPEPGDRYDVVWHDIWPNLCTDNLDEMAVLHKRWARRTTWQGSWGYEILKVQRRREQREERRWWTG